MGEDLPWGVRTKRRTFQTSRKKEEGGGYCPKTILMGGGTLTTKRSSPFLTNFGSWGCPLSKNFPLKNTFNVRVWGLGRWWDSGKGQLKHKEAWDRGSSGTWKKKGPTRLDRQKKEGNGTRRGKWSGKCVGAAACEPMNSSRQTPDKRRAG